MGESASWDILKGRNYSCTTTEVAVELPEVVSCNAMDMNSKTLGNDLKGTCD